MPAVRVSAIRWRLAVLALACTGLGCLVPYRPPTYEQPHAVLKYRRAYLMQAGASLSEVLSVDGYAALNLTVPSQTAATARTDAVMVHPQPATLRVDSTFFHNQTRSVEERYTEQVPYTASESYSCGSGYGTSYSCRTCTRTVTHYRSETRYRTVMRTERVVDAASTNWRLRLPVMVSTCWNSISRATGPAACRATSRFTPPTAASGIAAAR